MEDTQILALKDRMSEIEVKLDNSIALMKRIEQGIFGDEALRLPGLLKTHESLQDQIDSLKKEIEDLKRVNVEQDIEIKAKKGLTDATVTWLQRGFWAIAITLGLILLLTGEIGVVDLFKK